MPKKKKRKKKHQTVRLSPEKYIKKKVRMLPISECFITEDWEDAGMANILIARKHVSGGRTFGLFLVDLKCLGIKEVDYQFNESELDFEELCQNMKDRANLIPCKYELAHNIIYEGLNFAQDYGFQPHKDWEVGKYILKEDDGDVPYLDIPVGENGKPFYTVGPNDDMATQKKIIKTLERTAGKDNFIFLGGGEIF